MLIVFSPKAIQRFQDALTASLKKNNFSEDAVTAILTGATKTYGAIARQNAIKPLTLPDTGPDVLTTLRRLGKSGNGAKAALLQNPAALFEKLGIAPKEDPETTPVVDEAPADPQPVKATGKQKLPRATGKASKQQLDLDVQNILEAAKDAYKKTGLRPDTNLGVIGEGALKGTRWNSLYTAVRNSNAFFAKEGFGTLSQIFDVAMIGAKHRACPPEKAVNAYCKAFEIAAGSVPQDLFYLSKRHEDTYKRLPFVFRMLEDSLIEMQKQSPAPLSSFRQFDQGPLGNMEMYYDTVDGMFAKACHDYPGFPFSTLGQFIAHQQIYKKAKERLPEQKL